MSCCEDSRDLALRGRFSEALTKWSIETFFDVLVTSSDALVNAFHPHHTCAIRCLNFLVA